MSNCPAGYYCTAGVKIPLACPVGTYKPSSSSVAGSVADCTACLPSAYCVVEARTAPGSCFTIYYLLISAQKLAYGHVAEINTATSRAVRHQLLPHRTWRVYALFGRALLRPHYLQYRTNSL